MLTSAITLGALLLSSTVSAQTPPGFSPATAKHLDVSFQNLIHIQCPGCPLSAQDAAAEPVLSLKRTSASASQKYIAAMIDIDLIVSGFNTALLHWFQPDLTLDDDSRELAALESKNEYAIYGGPQPPSGQIHRYVYLLFEQPKKYKLPDHFKSYMLPMPAARVFFNISTFVAAAGLDAPVAANYFTVSGGDVPQPVPNIPKGMLGKQQTVFDIEAMLSERDFAEDVQEHKRKTGCAGAKEATGGYVTFQA